MFGTARDVRANSLVKFSYGDTMIGRPAKTYSSAQVAPGIRARHTGFFLSGPSSIRTGWCPRSMIDSNGPRLRSGHLRVCDQIMDKHCIALDLLV